MGASAEQFDYQSGYDLSSLSSATQAQVMQALSQIAPLSNIGGVILMSGGGGTDWPGVTNNPRFKRYIWIDTFTNPPVLKVHDQGGVDGYANWGTGIAIADGSITNAKLANATVQIGKLSITGGAARYIMRVNAANTAIEFANPTTIFNDGEVALTKLDVTGAPAGLSFLSRSAAGVLSWKAPTFSDLSGTLGVGSITPSGTNNQVNATVAGASTWAYVKDVVPDGDLPIAKLVPAGSALHALRRNAANTATEWALPVISKSYSESDANLISVSLPAATNAVKLFAHGLAALPSYVRVVALCVTGENGWVTGDEIAIESIYDNVVSGANDRQGRPCFAVGIDAVNITVCGPSVTAGDTANHHKTTGAIAVFNRANWRLKAYAWV